MKSGLYGVPSGRVNSVPHGAFRRSEFGADRRSRREAHRRHSAAGDERARLARQQLLARPILFQPALVGALAVGARLLAFESAKAPAAPLAPVAPEILDSFVHQGPLTSEELGPFEKAFIERSFTRAAAELLRQESAAALQDATSSWTPGNGCCAGA
jgi:hypothetical protein